MEKWNVGILIFDVQSVGDHADGARVLPVARAEMTAHTRLARRD
jgi:hypothetical protein